MRHPWGVGAEEEQKREASGQKPCSGSSSSSRRQVAMVEGRGPGK